MCFPSRRREIVPLDEGSSVVAGMVGVPQSNSVASSPTQASLLPEAFRETESLGFPPPHAKGGGFFQ